MPSIDAHVWAASIDALHPLRLRICWVVIRLYQIQPFLLSLSQARLFALQVQAGRLARSYRQILQCNQGLVAVERSEPALYAIEQELTSLVAHDVKLLPVLGSAGDEPLIRNLFEREQVQVVVHAAAYKHVPLVEANPLAGIANNVFSTRVICKNAVELGLEQVLLISTDKAVRPTNVMGASKRVAELVSGLCSAAPQDALFHGSFWQCIGLLRFCCTSVY